MACQREHDFKQTLINTLVTVLTHEFIEQDVRQVSLIVEACAVYFKGSVWKTEKIVPVLPFTHSNACP